MYGACSPLAAKIKTSAERDRVVAALRPAPLPFRDLDGLTPLIAAWLVGLLAHPKSKGKGRQIRPKIKPLAETVRER